LAYEGSMDIAPNTFTHASANGGGQSAVGPASGRAAFGQASATAMSMKWSALHDAAGVVAMLAGVNAEAMRPEVRNFPSSMRDAGGWRRSMAEEGVDDVAAIMEPGLAALLAVHARGADPRPAALALWQEFIAGRDALMALLPPQASGPKFFA
jgi:hypothetical protein